MTPAEIRAFRKALGMSCVAFAKFVRVASERTVRRWEDGDIPPPGPLVMAWELYYRLSPRQQRAYVLMRMES